MANGLNVVTVPYPSPGVAAFYIIVRVGSRDEIEIGKSPALRIFRTHDVPGNETISEGKHTVQL